MILHNSVKYGIESNGDRNEMNKDGYNEGATMTKYKGLYYLQYSTPGTQFITYADAVYVSENPLGPFTYMEDNPYSIKPGGLFPEQVMDIHFRINTVIIGMFLQW